MKDTTQNSPPSEFSAVPFMLIVINFNRFGRDLYEPSIGGAQGFFRAARRTTQAAPKNRKQPIHLIEY